MNLNPVSWFRKTDAVASASNIHENRGQGDLTDLFDNRVAREHNPVFWEQLREAMPIFDIAIQKLAAMDGLVQVHSENQQLKNVINEWMEQVRVNDLQTGYQSFYRLIAQESYEQGSGIGDFVFSDDGRDVVQLNVADSKGIIFHRNQQGMLDTYYAHPSKHRPTEQPLQTLMRSSDSRLSVSSLISDHQFSLIDPNQQVYVGYNVEADSPYGVSMMRSTEFVSKVLATMMHSLGKQWGRFGDPIFMATFKSGVSRDPKKLEEIKKEIANDIAAVMAAKANGNSADMVQAIGNKDDLEIGVLGALDSVLDIADSGSFIVNQLVAKTGLPAWVLGIGSAGQDAMREAEMVLMESRQRFAERKGAFKKPIMAMLRARGIAFKHDEWDLVQQLPSVSDVVAQAQATFLNAQARMMDPDYDGPTTLPSMDDENEGEKTLKKSLALASPEVSAAMNVALKSGKWAEDDSLLPRLSKRAERYLMAVWKRAQEELQGILKLDDQPEGELFNYENSQPQQLQLSQLLDDTIYLAAAVDGGLVAGMVLAHDRGLKNTNRELKKPATAGLLNQSQADILQLRQNSLREHALSQATNSTTLSLKDRIFAELIDGDYNNMDPKTVAARLKARFGDRAINYRQIAHAEIAKAHVEGKQDQYSALGIKEYHYKTTGDGKESSICRRHGASGPYLVGQGPLPVRDSHPECRCTIVAKTEQEE